MTVLMTGFPGFLGSALLPRILRRTDEDAVCLVQSRYAGMAARRVAEMVATEPGLAGRVRLVEGDITRPGLGLDDPEGLRAAVTEVWHLAAVYDLAVERDVAMRVNVEGTRYVLAFAERCPRLRRLHHFSTCYVSGRHAGPFGEDDLEVGAPFNNAYEETKHHAEVAVRGHMAESLPTTIYRPSVVVGDSHTGETQKFDGPYVFFQLVLRQPRVAVLPLPGDPTMVRVNMVPRDFVIAAVDHLSGLDRSLGRTYALADPHPLTVDAIVGALPAATGRRIVRIPLPRRVARGSITHIPGLVQVLRIPAESLDYLSHPTHYLTDHMRADLEGSGIVVPPLTSYLGRIIGFMREHPEVGADGLV